MSRAWQHTENGRKMARGELYHAFTPDLVAARSRCEQAWLRFNQATDVSRRERVRLWRDIIDDPTPLPTKLPDPADDEAQFAHDPWIQPPINVDYGTNLSISSDSFINFNCVFIDTCTISIGARTLVGPNVNFYSGTHPLDPVMRRGTAGPELGKGIWVGKDCWIGGNVTLLPGVRVGDGAVVGAGSVVTKDVPAYHVAAGNPAKVIRRIETEADPEQRGKVRGEDHVQGAEVPMAEQAS